MQCKTPAKPFDVSKYEFEDVEVLRHVPGLKESLYQVNLLINLKKLFGKMIYGIQKYYDPEEVFLSLLDLENQQFDKTI
jgi:hypothetical protein